MRRTILHIGPHKTGTTYLQRVFRAMRPALEAVGVAFPTCWSLSDDQPGHQKLCDALIAESLDAIGADFSSIDTETVLISSEDLSYLAESHLLQLRTILGDATVVFYCRRWSEILPSVWQERIKHGFIETFPQFVAAVAKDPLSLDFVDFGRVLDRFAAVFGKDRIHIVSYSNLMDAGEDIAVHFLDTLLRQPTLCPPENIRSIQPNRSLHPAETEVVRTLNAMHAAAGGERGAAIRNWFLREGHAHGAANLLDAVARTCQTLRLSDSQPILEDLHERLWLSYGDRVVAPRYEGRFFAPRTHDILYAPPLPALTSLYGAFLASTA
ncbi:MAG: hypothetical protein WCI94_01735 [Rhodospirillales bacterium]